MLEPKLISPMLDNFEMGGPISDHDGVKCCPAMRKNSDEKYIVKIISVPASQTKLDALLLTGAYSDKGSALAYFKDVADGIVEEKRILDNLAQLEGFVSFEDCQIVPMDNATGYDVYLLSPYRMTLERQNTRTPMTQLSAVNLGLDLCAALSVCRRSGYMCVDLKPSNIYVVGEKEYRIGDLGFVRLNSLKYESLPDKYRSAYTAPELEDPFTLLNDTMDIYSVGLILYQVFNGGILPGTEQQADGEKFASPAYADDEMAQIILKACDPDHKERWQDPVQMGQAIVGYMQKNGVNETPLTAEFFGPADAVEPDEAEDVLSVPKEPEVVLEETANEPEAADVTLADTITAVEAAITESDKTAEVQETVSEVIEPSEPVSAETEPEVEAVQEAEEPQEETVPTSEALEAIPVESENPVQDEEYANLSFLDDLEDAEKILADVGDDYAGVSDEVSEILGQIDDLAAHQVPDPVVAPEPVEIKLPDPISFDDPEVQDADDEQEIAGTDSGAEEAENAEEVSSMEDTEEAMPVQEELPEEEMPYVPKKKRTGVTIFIILAMLVALAAGAYFYYVQYYLQTIHSIEVQGVEDKLQVQIIADIDESLLTVVCSDSHGDKVAAPVVGGTAVFSGLSPDTAYTVTVEIDGFHELTGVTSKVYSTPVQTKILQVSAVTGSENGSVILNFTVEGPDSEQWNVIYNAEGEAERVTAFPSHMVTLAGLTVGKEYTFRLEPADDIYISGDSEIKYVVKNVVCAENLHIASFMDGTLTAQWDVPAGESIEEWTVRCYNESGFDATYTTAEPSVTISDLDESVAYTVEVTAAGMSVSQRVQVGANAVTVSDFAVDATAGDLLVLSWNTNREIPAEGWIIRYSINDIVSSQTVATNENAAQIPAVPNGNYVFSILDNAGNPVLGGPFTYSTTAANLFEGYSTSQSAITARLCKTPASSSWSYADLSDEDYVNSFASGEKISMVLALSGYTDSSSDSVIITYAIYNENDELVSFTHDSQVWQTMWYQNYCELDIPAVPGNNGTYKVIVYFDGMEVGSQKFEINS